ncbi:hypothetical protein D3C81_1469640 [compost metagenome]
MISRVRSSGRPRNTVENTVAAARGKRLEERAASATPRPSGKPMGRQARAREMVTRAPASRAWPQPPLAKESSDSCSSMLKPSRKTDTQPRGSRPCRRWHRHAFSQCAASASLARPAPTGPSQDVRFTGRYRSRSNDWRSSGRCRWRRFRPAPCSGARATPGLPCARQSRRRPWCR